MNWPVPEPLVVYCGAPGSGKTTHATHHFSDVLHTHDLRAGEAVASPAYWDRMAREAIRRLEDDRQVVIDACNTKHAARRRWLIVARHAGVNARLVVMNTRCTLCVDAQASRAHPVPGDVVRRYCNELRTALRSEIPHEPWAAVDVFGRS